MNRFAPALAALSLLLAAASSCSSPGGCATLSLDVCGNTPGCLPLAAQPILSPDAPDKTCLLDQELVTCGDALACDKVAPSRATDLTGHEWVLQSPCVPSGWTPSSTSASATIRDCAACSSLSLSACAQASYCAKVGARQIDAQRTCLLPEQDVGCERTGDAFATFHRRVVDPSGNQWITDTNFIPPGWHDSTSRDTALGDCAPSDGGSDGSEVD